MKQWKWMLVLGLVVAASMNTDVVRAFPQSGEWHWAADAQRPGAGDIFANGSAQDWGITCAHCHINDKQQQGHIDFAIVPSPAWQKVNGADAYKPGTTYTMTAVMSKAGTTTPSDNLGAAGNNNNINGFTLTAEDVNGNPMGTFRGDAVPGMCPANAPMPDAFAMGFTTYAYGNCNRVVSLDLPAVILQWSFTWQAPAAGSGDVTLYYGAVDGDGSKTLFGDDVKLGTVKLKEGP
ncbi:MAG TPA: hypothetical protein PK156_18910 [Polyangium sp.]|nr:hypothetical protein [Polyangium sp.]